MRKLIYAFVIAFALQACSTETKPTIDQKFVGNWKFYANLPKGTPNDHSMDAVMCPIIKMENSERSYYIKLWTGNELSLTVQDDSTLTATAANIAVIYHENNQHLSLVSGGKPIVEFEKLP